MLLANKHVYSSLPLRHAGGNFASGLYGTNAGCRSNFYAGDATVVSGASIANNSGFPNGARPPQSWLLAPKSGALASRNATTIAFTLGNLNLAEGRNIEGTTTVTFTLADAQLELVVDAVGNAVATFTVGGTAAGALSAVGNTSFAFTAGPALLGAIINMVGATQATFTPSGTIRATGSMVGNVTSAETLSPSNLAAAVWNRTVESGYTAEEVLKLLAAVAAGKTEIVDLGGGLATVTFRNLGDTKDTIVADMAGSDRTDVTRDP